MAVAASHKQVVGTYSKGEVHNKAEVGNTFIMWAYKVVIRLTIISKC